MQTVFLLHQKYLVNGQITRVPVFSATMEPNALLRNLTAEITLHKLKEDDML